MKRFVASTLLLLAVFAASPAGIIGCGPSSRVRDADSALDSGSVVTLSDDQFGEALARLLLDGGVSSKRHALLSAVVRHQFGRSAARFAAGQPERGLAAAKGAVFLIRAGELSMDMLDPSAADACRGAYNAVSSRGIEGTSLAFLRLRSKALPADHPDQARIRESIRALESWMQDTRNRSAVENSAADARAYGELSVFDPSQESVADAVDMTNRWMTTSVEFNNSNSWGRRASHDQMVAAYRGIQGGAKLIAAVYLRHGDANAAYHALDSSRAASRLTPPALLDRLDGASSDNVESWRDLAIMFAEAWVGEDTEEQSLPEGIAEGAAWGSTVAAYRANPSQFNVAAPMALLLATYGMSEAAPHVLTSVLRSDKSNATVSAVLKMIATILQVEHEAHDYESVKRVYAGSKQALAIANSVDRPNRLDPSPARIGVMMGVLHAMHGDLKSARTMLERHLSGSPSLSGSVNLADVLRQAGDHVRARKAIEQGLRAADASTPPAVRTEAHIAAFKIYRSQGSTQQARDALAAALDAALETRDSAKSVMDRTFAEALIVRLAYYYGDHKAWRRAADRMLDHCTSDGRTAGWAASEIGATGLLFKDVQMVRKAFEHTIDKLDPEKSVYAALWLMLTEQYAREPTNGAARKTLADIGPGNGWVYHLARYAIGDINDAALRSRAATVIETEEAEFYIAMQKHVRGEPNADAALKNVAAGVGINLVETFLANELTNPGSWGPSPPNMP